MSKSPPSLPAGFARCRQWIGQASNGPLKVVVDAVLPPRCGGCDDWHDGLFCPRCRSKLRPIQSPLCARCGLPFDPGAKVLSGSICAGCRANRYHSGPSITALRSIYVFEGPLREAVHRFKYHGRTALARPLAGLLDEGWSSPVGEAIPSNIDAIVPVPLQAWRQWRRGYNQSELLADELARRRGIAHSKVLWRCRHTRSQVELSARDRQGNVRDAFAIDSIQGHNLQDRSILLIDDVCTTGSTLNECARVLQQHGAGEVYALTLARQL